MAVSSRRFIRGTTRAPYLREEVHSSVQQTHGSLVMYSNKSLLATNSLHLFLLRLTNKLKYYCWHYLNPILSIPAASWTCPGHMQSSQQKSVANNWMAGWRTLLITHQVHVVDWLGLNSGGRFTLLLSSALAWNGRIESAAIKWNGDYTPGEDAVRVWFAYRVIHSLITHITPFLISHQSSPPPTGRHQLLLLLAGSTADYDEWVNNQTAYLVIVN